MQVDVRSHDVDLRVHQAAQAERDGRHVAFEEPGVADDRDIGDETLALRGEPRAEVGRAGFLLALEQVLDVDRQPPARREQATGRHQVGVDLALVVGCAAGQHPVTHDDRLERRRGPQLERIHRLDVVVPVDDDGRCVRGVEPVGVDDGVTAGLGHLGMLEAGLGQRIGEPLGGPPAVVCVLGQCRDARDPEERLVRLESGGVGRIEMGFEGNVGVRHARHCRQRPRPAGKRSSGPSPARSVFALARGPTIRPAAGSARPRAVPGR